MAAPNHGHAHMEHLQEVNRKPLKDELLPQGPERGNFTAKDPHSHTSLLLDLPNKKRRCRNEVLTEEKSPGLLYPRGNCISSPAKTEWMI
jgi:hypothetical protein